MEGNRPWTARELILLVVAVAALLFLAGLLARPARGDMPLLLHPTDDTFVLSDPARVDENFGDLSQIAVWANYPAYGARSNLKFDLSALPEGKEVTFAPLNLFQSLRGGFASGVDVFREANDAWTESTLTWANQPVLYPMLADRIADHPRLTIPR